MKRSGRQAFRPIVISLALLAAGCDWGLGRRRADDAASAGTAGDTAVVLTGCVELRPRPPRVVLRISPSDALSGIPAQSTAATAPWVGTNAYEVIGDAASALHEHDGAAVRVEGVLAPSGEGWTDDGAADPLVDAATDQVQAARGVRFQQLEARAIEILGDECASREADRTRTR